MVQRATKESVARAAEAVLTRGHKPTVMRVIEELGGGSPNTVLPLLNAWKEARPAGPPAVTDSLEPAVWPPDISSSVAALQGAVSRALAAERARSAETLSALQLACERRVAEIEGRAKTQIAEMREEAQALAEQLTAAQARASKSEETAKRAEERAQIADNDRRRAAELQSEQMRQLETAHDAIDAARKDEIVKLEAKLASVTKELRAAEGRLGRKGS